MALDSLFSRGFAGGAYQEGGSKSDDLSWTASPTFGGEENLSVRVPDGMVAARSVTLWDEASPISHASHFLPDDPPER